MAYDFNTWASQYNLTDAQKASVQSTLTNPDYIQRTRAYDLLYGGADADRQRAYDAAVQLGILTQTQATSDPFSPWTVTTTDSPGTMDATAWGTTGPITGLIGSGTGVQPAPETQAYTPQPGQLLPPTTDPTPAPTGPVVGGAPKPVPTIFAPTMPPPTIPSPVVIGGGLISGGIDDGVTLGGMAPDKIGSEAAASGLIGSMQGYTPTDWRVDPSQTVQGQVKNIIDENGPLQQQAETRSLQKMNERGLANTSIGIGAGQSALYDAALPMAQQDAATFANAAGTNAAARTTASQFLAQSLNQKELTQAQLDQQTNIANVDNQLKAAMANLDSRTRVQLQDMQGRVQASIANADNATKLQVTDMTTRAQLQMAQIESQYKTVMQTSATAGDMYSKGMNMITQIMLDPNLDAASKQSAVNNLVASLATGLQITGSIAGIDFGSLLDF